MVKIRKSIFVIVLAAAVIAGGFGGWLIGGHGIGTKYYKLSKIWEIIEDEYYIQPDESKLKTQMYKGLVNGLGDQYSKYMTKKEVDDWKASTLGEYEGVGIIMAQEKKTKNIVVVSVVKGSPAEEAGVRPGDIIRKVDGKAYDSTEDVAGAIRGPVGSKVEVQMERSGKAYRKTLTRQTITMETVSTKQLSGKIGYIRIASFENKTADDFGKALEKCETKGDKGLIIDLRDNGGGLVDSSVKIADRLMGKGIVTYMEDRQGKREYYRSKKGATKLPYVLLVNGNTASASEILTAAVMDNTNNKVVGTKTFGKGIVQNVISFKDGSALELTIRQYFSPKGKKIHKKGITPDYVVKGEGAQLKKAESLLR